MKMNAWINEKYTNEIKMNEWINIYFFRRLIK